MDWEVISVYTNEQAIEDGIKVRLFPGCTITRNALDTLVPDAIVDDVLDNHKVVAVLGPIMKAYDAGTYCDDSADYPEECDQYHAVYSVNGQAVWLMLDGDGMTILLPEDY